MDYVSFGRTGMRVSRAALGCMTFGSPSWRSWVLEEEASRPIIREAVELGINLFDTADIYSFGRGEEILGKVLPEFLPRDKAVIATKVYFPMSDDPNDRGLSRRHIFASIDRSLRRLGTDYVDLYQIHRWDPNTPIEETVDALDDIVRSGKVRYVGATTTYAWQLAKALRTADLRGRARFASMQNHYNLIYREEEREVLPLCRDEGLAVLCWGPLAKGFLAGNRTREDRGGETLRAKTDDLAQGWYYDDNDFEVLDALRSVAARLGRTPAEVAVAWVASRPGVTAPLLTASSPEKLRQIVGAVGLVLDDADVAELEARYRPHRIIGHE
jgi:aryl-alcohol dehydrogenase (NADP+)